jgi:hypothetical protein
VKHLAKKRLKNGPKSRAVVVALRPRAVPSGGAWAARITACWRASVEAILEVGRLLTAAKDALPRGEFGKMCENDLPFGQRTAERLMAIAADNRLTDPTHVSNLPASWGTLYELHQLSDAEFNAQIADGTICADMERKEVFVVRRDAGMAQRVQPRDDLDFAPTPPWATRTLMERVLPQIAEVDFAIREQKCWEPACGEGHMAEVLREYFRFVHATDIHDYGHGDVVDFLGADGKTAMPMDWIISNPPFQDKALAFALRALELAGVGVALFVQLRWLETLERYEQLFKPAPPTLVAIFVERVPLCMGRWEPTGTTATAYMWLVWVKDRAPQAPLWIPPGCREALTRPDDEKRFTAHPVIRRSSPKRRAR